MERPSPVWDVRDFAPAMPASGYVRDYVVYATSCMDAPPMYHLMSALGIVSAAISPQTDLVFQGQVHPLHLFLLIVGDSSASRKSSSIKRATRVAAPVFEAMHSPGTRLWWLTASSPEGILDELGKANGIGRAETMSSPRTESVDQGMSLTPCPVATGVADSTSRQQASPRCGLRIGNPCLSPYSA